jgi:hypothetical protein
MDMLNRINEYVETITSIGHIDTTELNEFIQGVISDYRKFWKKLDDEESPFNEIPYNDHVRIIAAFENIESVVNELGNGVTLYTEDTIKEHVEESMRENFYEFIDNIESGSWPYSYAEFDMESAIDEAIENTSQHDINGLMLFGEVDIYSIY